MRPRPLTMPNVDLSTLRGQELRSLLDSARARGQATLSYEILQEMAARRERGERDGPRALFTGRRPAEPRMIELALGDPLEREDEPRDEPEDKPPAWDDDPVDPDEHPTFLESYRPPAPKSVPRRWPWATGGLAVGLMVGLALGGWATTEISRNGLPPDMAAAAATLASAAPALQPAPAPPPPTAPIAAEPAPTPDSPPAPAAGPAPDAAAIPPDGAAATPPPPVAPIPAQEDSAAATTTPADDIAPDAPAAPKGCTSAPTPADRAICGDPRLQRLQRALRRAYAEALQAHQDRDLLRQHQLAWRDDRSAVADPDRLARLYEARIRKLNAATADALRER